MWQAWAAHNEQPADLDKVGGHKRSRVSASFRRYFNEGQVKPVRVNGRSVKGWKGYRLKSGCADPSFMLEEPSQDEDPDRCVLCANVLPADLDFLYEGMCKPCWDVEKRPKQGELSPIAGGAPGVAAPERVFDLRQIIPVLPDAPTEAVEALVETGREILDRRRQDPDRAQLPLGEDATWVYDEMTGLASKCSD